MKAPLSTQISSRHVSAASSKSILAGLLAACASCAFATAGAPPGDINNPFSTFPVTVDGQFTGGVTAAGPIGEWSDVMPAAFFSSPGASAVSVPLGSPNANSLLYAALGESNRTEETALFLMYDFLPRTLLGGGPISQGELLASIAFPVTLPGQATGEKTDIAVLFLGAGADVQGIGSFFDVFVDLDLDGLPDLPASQLGILGALGFGPSTLSPTLHLLAELEVPLRIPAGFASTGTAGPLPGGGINPATGLYDPAPAFWGAAAGADNSPVLKDGVGVSSNPLQSASSATFTINPNGSTTVAPIPEPSSAVLLIAGLGLLAARRRKS